MVAGGVVLVLVVAGLFVLTRGGDDEDTTDVTDLSSVPATDVVVTTAAPDVATTVVETTEAPSTTIEATTTVAPTTTAPPTTLAPSDQLVAALPTLADFPAGWTGPTSGTTTDPAPSSGPRIGFCGGGDAETRAIAAGMDAYAGVQAFVSPDGIYVESRLYGFPSPEAASAFIGQTWTNANACPEGSPTSSPRARVRRGRTGTDSRARSTAR